MAAARSVLVVVVELLAMGGGAEPGVGEEGGVGGWPNVDIYFIRME